MPISCSFKTYYISIVFSWEIDQGKNAFSELTCFLKKNFFDQFYFFSYCVALTQTIDTFVLELRDKCDARDSGPTFSCYRFYLPESESVVIEERSWRLMNG